MVIRDDQTIYQGFGWGVEGMIRWELTKVGGGFDSQHLLSPGCGSLVTGIKKPARGGFMKGDWGILNNHVLNEILCLLKELLLHPAGHN